MRSDEDGGVIDDQPMWVTCSVMHGHHDVDHAWGIDRRRGMYVRLIDGHHELTTHGMPPLLQVHHEWDME